MPASSIVKHLYDGSITLKDGTGSPVTLVVPFSTGDFSASGIAQTQREVIAYETRGTLNAVRYTTRTYVTGSFSAQLPAYTDASTVGQVYAFVNKVAPYASNVTTLTGPAEVYAVDVVLTTEGTNFGDSADHTITLTKCACTVDVTEGEPNTITVNFTCYGAVTVT